MKELGPPNDDLEETQEERNRRLRILIIIAVVFVMIIMILTFGWFYMKEREEEQKRQDEEIRRQEERERKIKRLVEVEAKIVELQAIKEKIKKQERRIIILTRAGIGAIFVTINGFYLYRNTLPFHFDNDIGKLLNLNAAILTCYSFVAFISYGTISNFSKRMKSILAQQLRKSHLHSLSELEILIKERDELKRVLGELQ